LLEAVMVMTVTAMMLTPVVAMLHLILGAERNTSKELRESLLLARISEQFRRDVHAATGSRLIPEPPERPAETLSLRLPNGQVVEYHREANRLTRTVTDSGRRIQQDRFIFRDGSLIHFAQEPESDLIAITIIRPRSHHSTNDLPAAVSATDRTDGKHAVTKQHPRQPVRAPKPRPSHRSVVRRRAPLDKQPPRHVIRLEAVLGRDHRFQRQATK